MQLREVGKLAVYLWKMQWLQRPSRWDLSQVVVFMVEATLRGVPRDIQRGEAAAVSTILVVGAYNHCVAPRCTEATPVSTSRPTWNCCCAGESDCLIET